MCHSPAYCLANLAMSSLLNTYCLVVNQCCSSNTTTAVSDAKTKSLKMIFNKDMFFKKHTVRQRGRNCEFDYMCTRRRNETGERGGERGVEMSTTMSFLLVIGPESPLNQSEGAVAMVGVSNVGLPLNYILPFVF